MCITDEQRNKTKTLSSKIAHDVYRLVIARLRDNCSVGFYERIWRIWISKIWYLGFPFKLLKAIFPLPHSDGWPLHRRYHTSLLSSADRSKRSTFSHVHFVMYFQRIPGAPRLLCLGIVACIVFSPKTYIFPQNVSVLKAFFSLSPIANKCLFRMSAVPALRFLFHSKKHTKVVRVLLFRTLSFHFLFYISWYNNFHNRRMPLANIKIYLLNLTQVQYK